MTAKVLVVEDDSISASVLKLKLENWGYKVPKIALTGNEAVKEAKSTCPDIIIMDISLKGKLDGIKTSELIDADFKTPIIYYSAKNDEKLLKKVKKLNNRDYISKTSEDEHLKLAIENQLKKDNSDQNNELKTKNRMLFPVVTLQDQSTEIKHGDENLNKIVSAKEESTLSRRVEKFQNQGYIKIKPVNGNLKPVIEKKSKEENFDVTNIDSSQNNPSNTENSLSKRQGHDYIKTRKKIDQGIHNLKKHFSDLYDKTESQELEIEKLKKAEEEYINSIQEKNKKIEEMGKHQQKLEEKLNTYKKQHQKMLNEVHNLKKQIDPFLPI